MLMGMAVLAADRSTCSRAQVGAVISIEGRPLSLGYNGAPSGLAHCDHACTCSVQLSPMGAGEHHPDCFSVKPCLISVHAEANAIAFAAKHGVAITGASMHLTLTPCRSCAQLIINAGIAVVVYQARYRDDSGLDILRNAGIALVDFSMR